MSHGKLCPVMVHGLATTVASISPAMSQTLASRADGVRAVAFASEKWPRRPFAPAPAHGGVGARRAAHERGRAVRLSIGKMGRKMLGPLEPLAVDIYRRPFIDLTSLARTLASICTPARIAEIGCGEGVLATELNRAWPRRRASWASTSPPNRGACIGATRRRPRFAPARLTTSPRRMPAGIRSGAAVRCAAPRTPADARRHRRRSPTSGRRQRPAGHQGLGTATRPGNRGGVCL